MSRLIIAYKLKRLSALLQHGLAHSYGFSRFICILLYNSPTWGPLVCTFGVSVRTTSTTYCCFGGSYPLRFNFLNCECSDFPHPSYLGRNCTMQYNYTSISISFFLEENKTAQGFLCCFVICRGAGIRTQSRWYPKPEC